MAANAEATAAVTALVDRLRYKPGSTLTVIPDATSIHDPAVRHGVSPAQVVFRFALQLGMFPLTGTSDPAHMAQDLAVYDFELSRAEISTIEAAGRR